MRRTLAGVVLLLLAGSSACAGVDYEAFPADPAKSEPGDCIGGIAYYESARYLLVYSNGSGNVEWRILTLPDQTKKRIIDPYSYASILTTSFTFDKGMLTEAKATADETAVVKALGAAVQSAIPLLLAAKGPGLLETEAPAWPELPPIHLFRVDVKGSTVTFTEADGAIPVQIPFRPKAP